MSRRISFHLFETMLGWIGIAWSEQGVTAVQTPDRDRETTQRRLLRKAGEVDPVETDNLPAVIVDAKDRLSHYAAGETVDFTEVLLDLSGINAFNLDIYRVARELGFGQTTTYGELARRAGHTGLARETGKALGENPIPIIVPCHRIVAAGGKLGGFSAPGGARTKERLLALEGVHVGQPPAAQAAFGF